MSQYERIVQVVDGLLNSSTVIKEIKDDVAELKSDVAELKSDVAELKDQFKTQATKLDVLTYEFQGFKDGLTYLIDEHKRTKRLIESIDQLHESVLTMRFVMKEHITNQQIHLSANSGSL